MILTARELAALLRKPVSWVYRHKRALGGFQPVRGGSVLFFENRIGEAYAVQDEKRQMESGADVRRHTPDADIRHETGCKKVGGRAKARASLADPHGLVAGN